MGLRRLTLPQLFSWKAAAVETGLPEKDKTVVFFSIHGGPPQHR
jgi:hypothetical protein